jgi:hypothetical protein
VEQKTVLQALRNQGVVDKYIRIIRIIYNLIYQKIKIYPEGEKFDWKEESNEVIKFQQNSSPVYWNIYSEG